MDLLPPPDPQALTITKIVARLLTISREFPTEELRLTLRDGNIVLGIPKGPVGDVIDARLVDIKGMMLSLEGHEN